MKIFLLKEKWKHSSHGVIMFLKLPDIDNQLSIITCLGCCDDNPLSAAGPIDIQDLKFVITVPTAG